eukprot:6534250-Ditylum_brightwellii.AAC.1
MQEIEGAGVERGKVQKYPAIPFAPDKESMTEVGKVKITLKFPPGTTGDKNKTTKNSTSMIFWQIWLNHITLNKPYKIPESTFDMKEMMLEGNILQQWRQLRSHTTGLPIMGVVNGEDNSGEEGKSKESGDKEPVGITCATYKGAMRTILSTYAETLTLELLRQSQGIGDSSLVGLPMRN